MTSAEAGKHGEIIAIAKIPHKSKHFAVEVGLQYVWDAD